MPCVVIPDLAQSRGNPVSAHSTTPVSALSTLWQKDAEISSGQRVNPACDGFVMGLLCRSDEIVNFAWPFQFGVVCVVVVA